MEDESEPLSRQLKGFLALPPSKELAKVELTKSNQELELLEVQVAGHIFMQLSRVVDCFLLFDMKL